jgi:hypothetical protein
MRSYYRFDAARGPLFKLGVVQVVSTEGQLVCFKFPWSEHAPWQWGSLSEADVASLRKKEFQVQREALLTELRELQMRSATSRVIRDELRRQEVEILNELTDLSVETMIFRAEIRQIALRKRFGKSFNLALPDFSQHFGFGFRQSSNGYVIGCPHWALVAISGVMGIMVGAASRIKLRFSLRMLLIVITLLAVGLGLAFR